MAQGKELHVPQSGKETEELHNPKDDSALVAYLHGKGKNMDVNAISLQKERAPIHSILCSHRRDRYNILFALLVHGNAIDVDLVDLDGMSPLHLAVQVNDLLCAKLLIAFGAKVNPMNEDGCTPLDLAYIGSHKLFFKRFSRQASLAGWVEITAEDDLTGGGFAYEDDSHDTSAEHAVYEGQHHQAQRHFIESEMVQFLKSVGGMIGANLWLNESMNSHVNDLESPFSAELYNQGAPVRALYKKIEDKFKESRDKLKSLDNVDELMASDKQQIEISRYRKTGSRILCLDGGGIRGLIEIDILHQLEMATGKKVTELFDWIVGTSIGAVLALGLVYGNMSLSDLRRLFFKLKDEVFSHPKLGIIYNTDKLESILKKELGTEKRMCDVKHPKVVISAVHKETTPLELHFFNNCFDDDLSEEKIWKVARCTSGGPVLFAECDNYVDGGVLANNPTEQGVAKIQSFHLERGEKLPISLVVSLGTGVSPAKKLGSVDPPVRMPQFLQIGDRVGNLVQLFSEALGESEIVARSCERNFAEQGIPYYRFSTRLNEAISSGETDQNKLLDMILWTRCETWKKVQDLAKDKLCNDYDTVAR